VTWALAFTFFPCFVPFSILKKGAKNGQEVKRLAFTFLPFFVRFCNNRKRAKNEENSRSEPFLFCSFINDEEKG
jgi:hypothetical protein